MTTNPSTRRWFQFSLRTLFVVVTLAAIPCWYVGEQWRIVQARKEYLLRRDPLRVSYAIGNPSPGIPWLREKFGDEGITRITIEQPADDKEMERIQALFPEVMLYQRIYPTDVGFMEIRWTPPQKKISNPTH